MLKSDNFSFLILSLASLMQPSNQPHANMQQNTQHSISNSQNKSNRSSKKILLIIFWILTAFLFAALGAGTYYFLTKDKECKGSTDSQQKTCTYNGISYNDGESFDATDGCNTCTCEDGEVACTLMACENGEETPGEDNAPSEDASNFKSIDFDLLGDPSAIVQYSLSFKAQVPKTATVDESKHKATNTEPIPMVTIEDSKFILIVQLVFEADVSEFSEAVKLFNHSQLGDIYRVIPKGQTTYEYSNDVSVSGTCEGIAEDLPSPCGGLFIEVSENVPFIVTCTASNENRKACDDVVKSFEVNELDI